MIKNRVALVSSRETVLRFFVSELTCRGCVCVCGSSMTDEMRDCACFIIDTEGEAVFDENVRNVLLVSRDFPSVLQETEMRTVYRLSFPTALRELNRFLSAVSFGEGAVTLSEIPERTACVPKEEENGVILYDGEEIRYGGHSVRLSETERKLLFALGRAEGEIVPRHEIASLLGDEKGNSVEVYICHLRNKLEKPFSVRLIETVRGRGYRIRVSLRPIDRKTNLSFAEEV